jgi:transaldolase
MTSPVARLNDFGQAPWYDNLTRQLVAKGELQQLIDDDGIRGVTSNPTIIEKAIASGEDIYQEQLHRLAANADLSVEDIYWEVVLHDIAAAADVLSSVHKATNGCDGFVSIEVSPDLAHNVAETADQARTLHKRLLRTNVMVKIPATREGVPAVEEMISEGRNINVTLIFSLQRYEEVIEAYLRGLERLAKSGGDLSVVHSVASFFVSRVDTECDRRLPESSPLRGKVAVANAKLAYEMFRQRFSGARWEALAAQGANVQRPLWASTSTKNPAYSDTLYVDELIGPNTVNTLAQASIDALRAGHGHQEPDTVMRDLDGARRVIASLAGEGVDFDDVTATIERKGVDAFARSFHDCIATLEKRRAELKR